MPDGKEVVTADDITADEAAELTKMVSAILLGATETLAALNRVIPGKPQETESVEFTNPFKTGGSGALSGKGAKFLSEEISAEEAADPAFKFFDKELLKSAKRDINSHGGDPKTMVTEAVKNNRVVSIGETHVTPNPQRDFGKSIMKDLAGAGITHLALEIPITSKDVIKNFSDTGELDVAMLPEKLRHDDFVAMLKSAREAKLKLVVADREKPGLERELSKYSIGGSDDQKIRALEQELTRLGDRDTHMAKTVKGILDENGTNKVVLWVGNEHLRDPEGNGKANTAVEQLREKHGFKVASFLDVGFHVPDTTMAKLTKDIERSVAVSIDKTPNLGKLSASGAHPDFSRDNYNHWDKVIIYPRKPAK